MPVRPSPPISDRFAAVLGVALVLAAAGLGWLALSSRLTSAGARIDRLQAARAELLEERSEALLAYASATDPRALEGRALAMGLGAPDDVPVLIAAPDGAGREAIGGALAVIVHAVEQAVSGDQAASVAPSSAGSTNPAAGRD